MVESSQKHLIMGTAGHIDHGKTSVIKMLTDYDCDTLKDEKLRGITINLGFTHLNISDDISLGIVDVPGHADFINTMVAGANGIDFVLMIIASDEGIMPQTREHLQIMQMLGIKKGIIVLTKVDLVDDELLDLAIDEVKEFAEGTFLEDATIIPVSTKDDSGKDLLIEEIKQISYRIEPKKIGINFRMFIDRIFQIKGWGTVVTGSVLSGELKKTDEIVVLPQKLTAKIRRLEHHGQETDEIVSGDRGSINLTGIEFNQLKRGNLISNKELLTTKLIDVKIKTLETAPLLDLWSYGIFLLGTFRSQAKVHLIDKDSLDSGETCIAQIQLEKENNLQIGDTFILRNTSGNITLGGGKIIDAHPLHHRRRRVKIVEQLKKISSGNIKDLIYSEVLKSKTGISSKYFSELFNIDEIKIAESIVKLDREKVKVFQLGKGFLLIDVKIIERWKNRILRHLKTYHKRNPLDPGGKVFSEIFSLFQIKRNELNIKIIQELLQELVSQNLLKIVDKSWTLPEHNVVLSQDEKKLIDRFERILFNYHLQVPLMSEMIEKAEKMNADEKKLKQILFYLVRKKMVYFIDGNYIHKKIVNQCRESLISYLQTIEEGITVSQFRDLIKGNRKICLLLLNRFDTEGITKRIGDKRFLTKEDE